MVKAKPKNPEGLTHDQLQAKCWRWGWNTYPQVHYLFFAVLNELPPAKGETKDDHRIRVLQARGLGLVPGILDLMLLWNCTHAFDLKVGKDHIKPEQTKFCQRLVSIGGQWHEIRLFTQFQDIFGNIVEKNPINLFGIGGVNSGESYL